MRITRGQLRRIIKEEAMRLCEAGTKRKPRGPRIDPAPVQGKMRAIPRGMKLPKELPLQAPYDPISAALLRRKAPTHSVDPQITRAMRAFAERFDYTFVKHDPESGLPFVTAAPFEGEEVVYLSEDGVLVFAFVDGSAPITLEELKEWTRSGEHPPLEFDEDEDDNF